MLKKIKSFYRNLDGKLVYVQFISFLRSVASLKKRFYSHLFLEILYYSDLKPIILRNKNIKESYVQDRE